MDVQTLCAACTQALMAGQNITLSLPKGYKWPNKFPRGELLRFARGQAGFHREIRARQVERVLVVRAHASGGA